MIRSKHIIELKDGVRVEMLFTPSMYERGRERGIRIEIEDQTNPLQVAEAYIKLMYLGAINAWEARRFDSPEIGDFPYAYIDFVEWSGSNPKTFSKMIGEIFQCIMGKTLKEYEAESAEETTKGVKKK